MKAVMSKYRLALLLRPIMLVLIPVVFLLIVLSDEPMRTSIYSAFFVSMAGFAFYLRCALCHQSIFRKSARGLSGFSFEPSRVCAKCGAALDT